jgi:hypothetical protein
MSKDIMKTARKIGMLSILQEIMMGKSLEDATTEYGISDTTFRRLLQKDELAAKELIEGQCQIIEGQYNAITVSRQRLIANMLKDAENPDLTVAEKLALEERLHQMQVGLGATLGINTVTAKDDAKDYLNGMALRKGHARITQTKTTVVEIDTNQGESIPHIIEGVSQ